LAEPTIKVKLIPDISGISGGVGAGMAGTPAGLSSGGQSQAEQKKMAGMFTIPITDLLSGIAKGIDRIAKASPLLAASMDMLGKGIDMALRPIGDLFAQLIRPLAMILIRFFGPLAAKSAQMGFLPAITDSIAEDPEGAGKAFLTLGGILLATGLTLKVIMSSIATALGLGGGAVISTAAGTAALGLPVALIIGGLLFGAAFGAAFGGKGGAIVGALAAATGLALAIGAGVTSTGGLILIPAAVAVTAVIGFKTLKGQINNFLESDTFKRMKDEFILIWDLFKKYQDIKTVVDGGTLTPKTTPWDINDPVKKKFDPFAIGNHGGFGTDNPFESIKDVQDELPDKIDTTTDSIVIQSDALYDAEGNIVAYANANAVATDVQGGFQMMTQETIPVVDKFTESINKSAKSMQTFVKWYGSLPLSTKRQLSAKTAASVWAGADMIGSPRRGGGGYSEMASMYSQKEDGDTIGDLYKRVGVVTGTG